MWQTRRLRQILKKVMIKASYTSQKPSSVATCEIENVSIVVMFY